jgi:hypothetical protein
MATRNLDEIDRRFGRFLAEGARRGYAGLPPLLARRTGDPVGSN